MQGEALCTSHCGFETGDVNIWFVTTDQGEVGVMIRDENSTAVIPVELNFPGMSQANLTAIILGTMGLLATVPASDRAMLAKCFDIAVIMTIVANEEDRRDMLSCFCDEETIQLLMTSAWAEAQFVSQVFTDAEREQVTNLCQFFLLGQTVTMQ